MRLLSIPLLVAIGACTASADEVRPPADQFFFPTGAAIAPDESVLFVANANSELRFDSGAVSVVDLAVTDQVIDAWLAGGEIPGGCERDPDHIESLICDEAGFLATDAGVRIGNFATDLSVQDLGDNNLRIIVPTRGDPSIAWADWSAADRALSCSTSGSRNALCDDDHRLSFVSTETAVPLPIEPFGVFADSAGEFALVTHLTSGAVSLIDSPRNGPAVVSDVRVGFFAPDPNSNLRGATGVAGRNPRAPNDVIYVGSRTEDRIQTFSVERPLNGAPAFLLVGDHFFLDGFGTNSGQSIDTRGIAFSATGDRMYVINRRPPSLQFIDTSLDEGGFPRNEPLGGVDVCRQASTVTVADSGDGDRAYVTCFQDGQIYVIDPEGPSAVDVSVVGRGPYAAVAAPTRKRLYVTNFLEDSVSVLDLTPGALTRNRVVLRIGTPRSL